MTISGQGGAFRNRHRYVSKTEAPSVHKQVWKKLGSTLDAEISPVKAPLSAQATFSAPSLILLPLIASATATNQCMEHIQQLLVLT